VQNPKLQVSSGVQPKPHPPQLLRSARVSMQALSQSVSPPAQTHCPPAQTRELPQAFAHAPQLLGSLLRSTHVRSQAVRPSAHPHALFRQVSFAAQPMPQPPQFARSLVVFTQAPKQSELEASLQAQIPPRHACPAAHARPHVPQ
jgi:hypothetical protein